MSANWPTTDRICTWAAADQQQLWKHQPNFNHKFLFSKFHKACLQIKSSIPYTNSNDILLLTVGICSLFFCSHKTRGMRELTLNSRGFKRTHPIVTALAVGAWAFKKRWSPPSHILHLHLDLLSCKGLKLISSISCPSLTEFSPPKFTWHNSHRLTVVDYGTALWRELVRPTICMNTVAPPGDTIRK